MKSICLTKEDFDNMKMQWTLLIGLAFAIIIAIFATVNVGRVPVDYIFGEAYWPLVLVILGSALLGALIRVCFAGTEHIFDSVFKGISFIIRTFSNNFSFDFGNGFVVINFC